MQPGSPAGYEEAHAVAARRLWVALIIQLFGHALFVPGILTGNLLWTLLGLPALIWSGALIWVAVSEFNKARRPALSPAPVELTQRVISHERR